ncbi:Auxin-repressed protein [Vigna angularis]|uniref:Auxin-repressed protein n=1 Tax=Phaseolus angularis TaxID=3914 RepID=A0A8T0K8X1_PHAAN|nr:Auxin-repressed protein [Vigna angularis]
MVLLEKLWDDVVAGPQPDRGLGKLRKLTTLKTDEGESSKLQKSLSMPTSPTTPLTPSTPTTPGSGRKSDNVWRSVFHPGSNSATKTIGLDHYYVLGTVTYLFLLMGCVLLSTHDWGDVDRCTVERPGAGTAEACRRRVGCM